MVASGDSVHSFVSTSIEASPGHIRGETGPGAEETGPGAEGETGPEAETAH